MTIADFYRFRLFRRIKLVVYSRLMFWLALVIAVSIFATSCKQPYSPEKAKKYIIAADQELINTVRRTMNSDAFNVLSYLSNLEIAPLPGKKFPIVDGDIPILFDMQTHSGYYQQSAEGKFEFIRSSDSLIMDFNLGNSLQNTERIIISAYQKEMTAFGDSLPVKLDVVLFSNAKTIMDLKLHAEIQHEFPENLNLRLLFGGYSLEFKSNIKFGNKYSHLQADFVLKNSESELLRSQIKTNVMFAQAGTLDYEVKNFSFSIFPISFALKSNYLNKKIPINNFVSDFNKKIDMRIFDRKGKKIAQLFLKELPDSDQLNMFVRYSDGTTEDLEDIMLSARTVLQYRFK